MITNEKAHGLTGEEIAFYEQNGYVLAKGVFTREEAALFREETHALAHRLMSVSDPSVRSEGWTSGAKVTDLRRELVHCHNVQFHSAALARLIIDPRLTDRAADIIGPNVQLHHTKMFIKPPERGRVLPKFPVRGSRGRYHISSLMPIVIKTLSTVKLLCFGLLKEGRHA